MTVNQERQPWPLHLDPDDGKIHCPACNSEDVRDTKNKYDPIVLEEIGVSEMPTIHECNACGNIFTPVDALEHPMRTYDNLDVL